MSSSSDKTEKTIIEAVPEKRKETDAKPETPRKRGRPKGSVSKKKKETSESKGVWAILFSFLERRNSVWKISEAELNELSEATDNLLKKYIGESEYKEEIAFFMVASSVIMPRYMIIKAQSSESQNEKIKGSSHFRA